MPSLRNLLLGLLIVGSLGAAATPAQAQAPEQNSLRIDNHTAVPAFACIGGNNVLEGWFKIEPGQSVTYNLGGGLNPSVKVLVMKEGRLVSWAGADNFQEKFHFLHHPTKAFALRDVGDDRWRLRLEGEEKGVFNRRALLDMGFTVVALEKFAIDDDGRLGLDIVR